jgi:cellulose synthase (UDP-forming)
MNSNPNANKLGGNILGRSNWLLNILLGLTAVLATYLVVTASLTETEQFIFGLFAFVSILVISKQSWGHARIVVMIVISILVTSRYMYWRITSTTDFVTPLDVFFGWGLVLAEIYTYFALLLGYLQTIMPLQRPSIPMSLDQKDWPIIDVMIPTYNESLSVVRTTILAAKAMDWPADKLRVHLLDDGRREEFRDYCNTVGVNYLTRDNNRHNKAGNLNAALKVTNGDYVLIFDCDHIPTRSYLQIAMGWFSKDPKLALVQSPHYLYSPDPFEKNLKIHNKVPNEGMLFYGLVQDGNDLWNASFFCGSCAILERKALMEVGGIAVETVTEDAHTALKLSRKGYNLAYLAIPQAAGLATESFSGHIIQRRRWARGMAQIFRIDNPLLGRGLSIFQRLCYTNAMLHFFYGLPRLVFLTAPLAYLIFGAEIFSASVFAVVIYAIPSIFIANITNSLIQGRFRHSFWNEVYETALSWYILFPVLLAMINPKFGAFNATAKGGTNKEDYVDWKSAIPIIILFLLNCTGIVAGVIRLTAGDVSDQIVATIGINLVWAVFNLIIISAAVNTALEARQVRKDTRLSRKLPATINLPDGKTIVCETVEFSQNGFELKISQPLDLPRDSKIMVSLFRGDKEVVLPCTVKRSGKAIGVLVDELTTEQQNGFVQTTFSRADNWINVWNVDSKDSLLRSFGEVMKYGILNLVPLFIHAFHDSLISMRQKNQRKPFKKS